MAFSFPTIKEFLKTLSIDHTYSTQHIEQVDEKFYYRPSTTEEYNYAVIYEDESFTALIDGVSNELAVIIMNRNKEPICCITAQQIIPFLVKSYNELQSFYNTVIQTTDSSVTVIDDKERVRTDRWRRKDFSVKYNEIIGQPITRFLTIKIWKFCNHYMTEKA